MFLATSPWLSCGHTSMCLLGNRREAELEVEQKVTGEGKAGVKHWGGLPENPEGTGGSAHPAGLLDSQSRPSGLERE